MYEDEFVATCPACGEFIDFCLGHGELGDSWGARVLEAHDAGDHLGCHPTAVSRGECEG